MIDVLSCFWFEGFEFEVLIRHLEEPYFSRHLEDILRSRIFPELWNLTSRVCKTSGRDFLHFSGKNQGIYHDFRSFQVRIWEPSMIFRSPLVVWDCRYGGSVFSLYDGVAGKKSFATSSAQLEGPLGRRQGYYSEFVWCQAQSGNSRFLVAGPVGRRQGYNCNLGTRDFLAAGPVTTAIWEFEFFGWQAQLPPKKLEFPDRSCNWACRQKISNSQIAVEANWACHQKSRVPRCRLPTGHATKEGQWYGKQLSGKDSKTRKQTQLAKESSFLTSRLEPLSPSNWACHQKISSSQIAVVALSPSNWACHQKNSSSQIAVVAL